MSRRRPWCRITIDLSADAGWIRARDARSLIEDCGGRAMWSARQHAWHCSAATAADVLALADVRGYAVTYERAGGEAS